MDHQVNVICTAAAGRLMLKGVAEAIRIKPDDPRRSMAGSRRRTIRVRASGRPGQSRVVRQVRGRPDAECSDLMGAAAMIQDIMDGECKALTFSAHNMVNLRDSEFRDTCSTVLRIRSGTSHWMTAPRALFHIMGREPDGRRAGVQNGHRPEPSFITPVKVARFGDAVADSRFGQDEARIVGRCSIFWRNWPI